MTPISIEQYLGSYATHADATSAIRGTAARTLDKVNAGLLLAELDGVKIRTNPLTGSHVAGSGNGGFRPKGCAIGAASSKHKSAEACDIFDPLREIAAWSLRNKERLQAIGILAIERPSWTPTWCHWQVVGVPSGHFAFIPSSEPPLAMALPGELSA